MDFIKEFLKKFSWCRKLNIMIFDRYYKQSYTQEEVAFIMKNRKLWENEKSKTLQWVAVEFTTLAPDNFWGVMKKACVYREKYGCKIIAILNGININSCNNAKIIESFNIDEIIYKDRISLKSFLQKIKCLFYIIDIYCFYQKATKLIEYKIGNVKIGDCIYDTIIRSDKKIFTLEKIRIIDIQYIYIAIMNYISFCQIKKDFDIKAYLIPEYAYLSGIRIRAAVDFDIKVHVINEYKETKYTSENVYTGWLDLKNDFNVHDVVKLIEENDVIKCQAEEYFANRIQGKSEIFDAKNSFKNKISYDKHELLSMFSIENSNKNVFIMPNIFFDAIHSSKQYIFKDYYEWFLYTLEKLSGVDKINLFVKPHPTRNGYGETGIIENIVKKYPNVNIISSNISTLTVLNTADVILSGSGTIGLEASCVGIPVIITSDAYYNGFDLTYVAKTINEYEKYLNNITELKMEFNENKLIFAKVILFLAHNSGRHSEINFKDMNILPGENFNEIKRKQYEYLNKILYNHTSNIIKDAEYELWMHEL